MKLALIQNIAGMPTGKKELIKQFQSTDDIINAVVEQHNLNRNAFKKIAPHFQKSTDYDTCQAIWEFTHYNLNYKAEPNLQTVKTLSKILYDGANHKGNDCKHFSCFEAGILEALNIPYFYRFAAYSGKIPTHVYVVAKVDGNEIIMDAVLPYFDSEKDYTYKIDINPLKKKDMPLYRLSGVKTVGKIGATVSKLEHNAKKITFAPGRLAFLKLVEFNVFGLGEKVNTAIMKNRPMVEEFWYNQGGTDFDKLLQAGIDGKFKNRIFGLDRNSYSMSPDYPTYIGGSELLPDGKIGLDPATITAGIASAAAIIGAVKLLFDKIGIKHNDVKTTPPAQAPTDTTAPGAGGSGLGISTNTILLVALGFGAFMLLKKK